MLSTFSAAGARNILGARTIILNLLMKNLTRMPINKISYVALTRYKNISKPQ